MPTYVYQVIEDDGSGGEIFEVFQKMSEPALTKHPETGQPVKRLIQPPNIGTKGGMLSDKNLDRLGFTKYQNAGGGHFEKRAGTGPDVISAD